MEGLNFYKGRVCLNCLTNSVDNAKAIYEAAEVMLQSGFCRQIIRMWNTQWRI